MSEHQELKLCIGVKQAAGDSSSAETGYEEITLLGASTGLQLVPGGEGWVPQIAQAKPGIWRDGPYTPGRTPDALPVQNVIETMKCRITAGTHQEVYRYIEALNRFITRARGFFTGYAEIEPVFLHWWAYGASGPQFALLYNIDAAIGDISNVGTEDPTVSVTMTLEREPAWRWQVPPGGNPKLWTLRNQTTISLSDLSILSATNDLVNADAQNRYEIDPADSANPLSKNLVTIPAASIPGDAPALLTLGVRVGAGGTGYKTYRMICGVNHQTYDITDKGGYSSPTTQILSLAAADFTTSWTKTADVTGLFSNGSSVTRYYVGGTAVATTEYNGFATFYYPLRTTLYHGKYAAFVRCRQTNGAAGDVQVAVGVADNGYYSFANTNFQNMPLMTPGATGIRDWNGIYCGEVSIPLASKISSGDDGRGLPDSEFYLAIHIKNNNASTRTWRVLDLILIPVSDGAVQTTMNAAVVGVLSHFYMLYDNSTYMTHGEENPKAVYQNGPGNVIAVEAETRGNIYLAPNRENRLFFLFWHYETNEYSNPFSTPADFNVYLNIVPRSYGPRTD